MPPGVRSQELQGIAAVVNDDVISMYDLYARMKMVLLSLEIEDSPEVRKGLIPQIISSMVDERLKLQEAKKQKISINKSRIEKAVQLLEDNRKIERGEFAEYLALNGVDISTLKTQIRADLTWREVTNRRLLPQIDVGNEEILEVIARMKQNKGKPEYLVAEIFLQVDTPDQKKEIRATAEKIIGYLEEGRSFPQLARQFSHSASAASGGDIGWILPGDLNEEVEKVLTSMEKGSLYGPISSLIGFHIVLLRDKRISGSQGETNLELHQIFLSFAPGASKQEVEIVSNRANELRSGVFGCDAMASLTDDSGASLSNNLGTLKLGDLPSMLQDVVKEIEVGKPSEPKVVGNGVMVLMVCNRTEPKSTIPEHNKIAKQIEFQRLDLMAQRYLRDLRRAAHLDIRIE
jgi:peptidyl-prolyl cis-trans isomerase SurA